jgi:hypothetical protein
MKQLKSKYPNVPKKFVITENGLRYVIDYSIEKTIETITGLKKI